jgi:hypothetical protein
MPKAFYDLMMQDLALIPPLNGYDIVLDFNLKRTCQFP